MDDLERWGELAPQVRSALVAAWRNGMPGEASALYARWWQLETWLRSLVYVERSARWGRAWAEGLPSGAERREQADLAGDYMASPDAQARLAYLDVGPLFKDVIPDDWSLYSGSLVDDINVWKGRAAELLRIRHRIGHCRRPHPDDLNRVEQLLRDLEPGAFRAISSFNDQFSPDRDSDDAFVAAWCRGEHRDALRLVDHADNQYEISLRVAYSRRPWAQPLESGQPVSGSEGYLWHVGFIFGGRRPLDLRRYWSQHVGSTPDSRLVYLTALNPFQVEFSFAAVDDASETADEVGRIFDRILTNRVVSWEDEDPGDGIERIERWQRSHKDLDARVQVATAWSIVDSSTTPIILFGA